MVDVVNGFYGSLWLRFERLVTVILRCRFWGVCNYSKKNLSYTCKRDFEACEYCGRYASFIRELGEKINHVEE